MKIMFSCKEMTEICCDDDRKLSMTEKMMFFLHIGMCKACALYKKQVEFMSKVMKKTILERSVVDEEKVSKLEKDIIEKMSKGA